MKHRGIIRICATVALTIPLHLADATCFGQSPSRSEASAVQRPISPSQVPPASRFVVVSEDGSAVPAAIGASLETILSRLSLAMTSSGLTVSAGTGPLVWVCFDDPERYRQYAQDVEHAGRVFPEAYYSTRANHVVLFCGQAKTRTSAGQYTLPQPAVHLTSTNSEPAGARYASSAAATEHIRVLTHEMAHQLSYNSGLQKRGVMYPLWVSEGLATFFENSALSAAEAAAQVGRQRRLVRLASQDQLLPLRELAVLAGPEALESAPVDIYAQCWGLFGFLLHDHPDKLSAYLSDSMHLPLGRRSPASMAGDFARHFGRVETLEDDWHEFVASLSSPVADTKTVAADRGL